VNGYSFYESDAFWNYVDQYAEWVKQRLHLIDVYVNVDVIFNPELSWKTLKYLENTHDLNPLPVIHANTDKKWLYKHLDNYEYLGIGGVGQEKTVKEFLPFGDMVFNAITDTKGYPTHKTHGFAMTSNFLLNRFPWYCMTEEDHEVLTKKGWKKRSKLQIGEEILAFDEGVTKWEPILDIPVFPVKNEKITHIENRNIDAHISNNHRWITTDHNKRGLKWRFKETDYLTKSDAIPRVGKDYKFPTEKKYSDEQVKLLGWIWTDGSMRDRSKKGCKFNSIIIYQSKTANPKKCKEIETLLNKSKEKYCICKGECGMNNYEIYGNISKWIWSLAPDKKIPLPFIFDLTKDQLKMFIDASIKGDGTLTKLIRRKGIEITVNRSVKKENLEILRIGYLLLGIPTSIFYGKNNKKSLRTSSVDYIYNNQTRHWIENYTGNLWCVKVKSGAFFTRCNEKIYVTGNSVDSTAWAHFGRFGAILIPKLKNGKYDYKTTPIILFISDRSTKKDLAGKHLDNFSKIERKMILKYIKDKGYILGKSEYKKVPLDYKVTPGKEFRISKHKNHTLIENCIEKGVKNNNLMRDFFNAEYYKDLANSLPEWPWKFKHKERTLF